MRILELEQQTTSDNCIAVIEREEIVLCVYEHGDYRWLTFGDQVIQGVMSISRPELLLSPISALFMLGFMQAQASFSILNLGLGTGALERAFLHLHKQNLISVSLIHSVELSAEVAECAQRYFNLKTDDVMIADACRYLNNTKVQYDLVLLDFCFDNAQDDFMQSTAFFKQISSILNKSGRTLFNFNPYSEGALINLLKQLKQYFVSITLIEFNDLKNIVIQASKSESHQVSQVEFEKHPIVKAVSAGTGFGVRKIYHF